MPQTSTFFHELTFDQLSQLADQRFTLKINPTTSSETLRTVNKQLFHFKELLEQFYFNPEGFVASPFFKLDPFLVFNFLRLSHEYYLDKKIPEIEQYIGLIIKSNDSPEARVLAFVFNEYKNHLAKHIAFEEKHVFPLIRNLIESRSEDKLLCQSAQVRTQLVSFYVEHSDTEKDLVHIKELVKRLSGNERGVSSVLTNQLELLEADLKLHHILEEEILIPSLLDIIF
jgi:regulator of cell morphogenesis and NO signaling